MKMLLDGLQRTQTIESFKQDKFAINKNAKPFNGVKIAGKKYSQLPDDIKRKIDEYIR